MENITVTHSAPGKIILCGEHSVVYGRPAIAVPVSDLRAYAEVCPGSPGTGLLLRSQELRQEIALKNAPQEHTLGKAARLVLQYLKKPEPDAILTIRSSLPIAAGMGSGAAVAAASIHALSDYLGQELPTDTINTLTYEVEKIHHGTPSGIDNTVIAWEKPVYFVREQPTQVFNIGAPFHMLIASSGVAASTKEAVSEVRRRLTLAPDYYNAVFNCIGNMANAARAAVENGDISTLGILLDENHQLLKMMGVSLPELDRLIEAARSNGARGAKLTGSGQGGNIIALVDAEQLERVEDALLAAGAAHVWHTMVRQHE
ncbi:MAG: mevalonate kinase [Anaerolineae bacterium]|nr:mevalonate kinase [Anaerolineae bacterium]